VSPGDDAVGIGTAFLHSGASSLLVSLWKVEDVATAALMKSFYQRWIRDGKDKGRALRESKLELIAGRFPHPRQWGAFVLIGEP
jgi:CHAT domain-containing protein